MQETHPLGYGLFRSYEPKGFRMLNRSFVAERVGSLPSVDDEGLAGPGWFEAGPVTAAFISLHDSSPADPPTRVRILFSDDGLFVGAECGEPDPAGMRTLVPAGHETGSLEIEGAALKYEFWKDDHFVLSVDPTHEAGDYYNFIVTAGGYARAGLMNYGYAEQVHANCRKADRADVEWHRRAAVAGDAWYAFYSVPWSSLGLSGPPEPAVVGFNALRYRGRPEGTTTSWTRVVSSHGPAAIDFGDLHLGDAKVFMPVADFRSPVFDHNTLKVTLEAPGDDARVGVRARVETAGGEVVSDEATEVDVPAGRTADADVPYLLTWQERNPQRMTLEISDAASGRVLFRTRYRMARSGDIGVTNRFDFPEPPPNPSPGEEDFVTRKRNWLNWKTGQFHRKTTAQGAPSDFCFERADGGVLFNMMEPGACRRMAEYIEGLFEKDIDRMCGAALMMHQKVFAMHCGPLTALHTDMTPESAIRLNGGHCYSRALSLAGVMREIRYAGSEEKYDATIMFNLGHVVVVLRHEDGERYLFDPSFGAFFYHHDDARLATETELFEDPSLHERYIRGRRKDFCSPETHTDGRTGRVVWPPGAPCEQG